MLRHVVLLRWSEDVDTSHSARVAEALSGLPARIPSIRTYRFGPDAGVDAGTWDFAITADFDDEDGYIAYRDDPLHREVIDTLIRPNLADRSAVQFHLD